MQSLTTAKRLRRAVLAIAAGLILGGCAQMGPELMKAGRNDYNKVLAQTDDEQVLLNLVRLRYADNPVFLNVASLSTSFTWGREASAQASIYEEDSTDTNLSVRGSADYTERPTVTYAPLGGADFVKNVLTPMDLNLLLLLSSSGWSLERLLRLTVNRMNGIENAPEASGPTPQQAPAFEDFKRVAKLMRTLQSKRMVTLASISTLLGSPNSRLAYYGNE